MDTISELWLPIDAAPGYDVSDAGRVRSNARVVQRRDGKPLRVAGRILLPRVARGYARVSLPQIGAAPIHRLVALAFVPCPGDPAMLTVNHIDGVKANNVPSNLEWLTAAENAAHAHRIGLNDTVGSANGRAKLTDAEVAEIRRLYALGRRQTDLAARFGIDQTGVSRIVLRKSWRNVA